MQSGARFEPGQEVQNRGSNCQLGYGRELDFRRNLNRNTGILNEMLSTTKKCSFCAKAHVFACADPPEARADSWSFFELSDPVFN